MARPERGLFKRGPIWWLQTVDPFTGERVRESCRTRSIRKARLIRATRVAELEAGRGTARAARGVTITHLLDDYRDNFQRRGKRSVPQLDRCRKHLLSFFGPKRKAMSVRAAILDDYVMHRQDQNAAPATIKEELALLRAAFRLAHRREVVPTVPPFPAIEVHNIRQGFLSAGDMTVLLVELPEYLAAPTEWAYVTAWRMRETFGLRWDWIDMEAGTVTLPGSLSKNEEPKPLEFVAIPALRDLIQRQWRKRSGPYVFPGRAGKPIRSHYVAWKAACRRAGLAGTIFHDLRRSAIRNMERAGVSRSVAMKISGHKTEAVYVRYAITDEVAMREGLKKLAALDCALNVP